MIYWIKWQTRGDIRRQIKKEFDEGGIEMYQPILPGNGGAQK